MNIAFLCAGQGAQQPGMGLELYNHIDIAKKTLDAAEAALGAQLRPVLFDGPAERLNDTRNAQTALAVVEMMTAKALMERGVIPKAVAGFSLGEYPALCIAGVMQEAELYPLLRLRANAMADVSNGGGMLAVLGCEDERLTRLCSEIEQRTEGLLRMVNYNCPGQRVVAGDGQSITLAVQEMAQQGIKAVPLAVSGPFHTPLMSPAAQAVGERLKELPLAPPACALYLNYSGDKADGLPTIVEQVSQQTMSPVRFESILRAMDRDGIDTFIEIGPGKTLSGFVKRTLRDKKILNVQDLRTLEETVQYCMEGMV